jgi:hypothetical protein
MTGDPFLAGAGIFLFATTSRLTRRAQPASRFWRFFFLGAKLPELEADLLLLCRVEVKNAQTITYMPL